MKRIFLPFLTCLAFVLTVSSCAPKAYDGIPLVILETDMGNDIDDALCLALAHRAMDEGRLQLLAVGCHKNCPTAAPFVDAVNRYYGHPEVEVAMSETPVQEFSNYTDYTAVAMAAGFPVSKIRYPEPVQLYRRILSEAKDGSISFVSVGFGTTIAQLLESEPDEISPLNGVELVAKKCKCLSVMAGSFGSKKRSEYNVKNDIPAMQKVIDMWPVEIILNPFEIGGHVLYPASAIEANLGYSTLNPVVEAYKAYKAMPYDRPCWDLLSMLYLLEPELYTVSAPGTLSVDDEGYTYFEADPNGRHVVLFDTFDQAITLKERLVEMTMCHKKLVAFDLDATLSAHRCPVEDANLRLLDTLTKKYEVIMCCAGTCSRVYNQMGQYPVTILGNYGMQESHIVDGEFTVTREEIFPVDTAYFMEKTNYLREKYGYTEYYGAPVEFHETGMVTFGLLGKAAPIELKHVFDPDRSKRRVMYQEVCELFPDYSVYIGGSSSFDFSPKQYNKYDAVMKYASEHGYTLSEILFVGDDFGDGGGDSHVRIKGMDYVSIDDCTKTPEKLSFLL